jgi:hypothetical protein
MRSIRYRSGLRVLLLCGSGLLMAAPAWADPPPWAPAHGQRAKQYHYTYYPDYGIYYAPESRLWFWLDGDNWRFGASLPLDYRPYATGGGVSIELGSERPYDEHGVVVERYGKPKKIKAKKHNK